MLIMSYLVSNPIPLGSATLISKDFADVLMLPYNPKMKRRKNESNEEHALRAMKEASSKVGGFSKTVFMEGRRKQQKKERKKERFNCYYIRTCFGFSRFGRRCEVVG